MIITSVLSVASIPFSLNNPMTEQMLKITDTSRLTVIVFSLLGGLASVTAGIGMLKGQRWGRQLYLVMTPIAMVGSLVLYGFKLFAMFLMGFLTYVVFAVLLTRKPVSNYFSGTVEIAEIPVYNVQESSAGRKVASIILLILGGLILNTWFMMILPISENMIALATVSAILFLLSSALIVPAIFLWGRKKWAGVLGTLLISVGGTLSMVSLMLWQFTSVDEFRVQIAQVDPMVMDHMIYGSVIIGIVVAVIGTLLLVLHRAKNRTLQASGVTYATNTTQIQILE